MSVASLPLVSSPTAPSSTISSNTCAITSSGLPCFSANSVMIGAATRRNASVLITATRLRVPDRFPDVSLKQARERRADARRLLVEGIDPGEHRKITKTMATSRAEDSFEAVAREWFAKFSPRWAESHASKVLFINRTNVNRPSQSDSRFFVGIFAGIVVGLSRLPRQPGRVCLDNNHI